MKQVIIIGAGPAGLSAAHRLLQQAPDEYKVTILEKSDEIGGIARTVRHAGNRMDMGGHRFYSKDKAIMQWWTDMLPLAGAPPMDDLMLGRYAPLSPHGPDPQTEDEVMLVRRRVSRIYYGGQFFDYPIQPTHFTLRRLGLRTTLRAGLSYLWSSLFKRPETNLENFYINRFGKVLYSMFFKSYTEKLWGRPASQISADWGVQRVKGLSIRTVLQDMFGHASRNKKDTVETSLIQQFYYPKHGPGQLWETVADKVQAMGGTLIKKCKVVGFRANKDGHITEVQVETQKGKVWLAGDIVLSSMPIKDLVVSLPRVPKPVAEIAKELPYRDFVTLGLLVRQLALTNNTDIPTLGNTVPDCWIYIQDKGVKLGRVQIFNNWSPYMVKDPQHTVWLGLEYFCEEGDDFWKMKDADLVRLAQDELERVGILAPGAKILASHRERVPKAYPAYFGSYAQMEEVKTWLDSHDNLYCIGRNGQHHYNNMDHSMATAFLAVENILGGRATRQDVWNVNIEKSYHEEKEKKRR